jgi:4,5-DOPA dioxygenase extradiol
MTPIFLSHGSPMLVLEATPTTEFLRTLGRGIGTPRAAIVVSAHWETARPAVGAAAAPTTIHDFFGFPQPLYDVRYPAPGAPELAARVAEQLDCAVDGNRGLDHGVWCPAALMWPEANVPIVPLSIQPRQDARHHYALGQRLRPLLADGEVLLLASGALTHNLRAYFGRNVDDPAQPWVTAFADWIGEAATAGRTEDLLDWRDLAPHAADNHPTDEHLLPLFVALGASAGGRARVLHRAVEYGVLAMDAYAFD